MFYELLQVECNIKIGGIYFSANMKLKTQDWLIENTFLLRNHFILRGGVNIHFDV